MADWNRRPDVREIIEEILTRTEGGGHKKEVSKKVWRNNEKRMNTEAAAVFLALGFIAGMLFRALSAAL